MYIISKEFHFSASHQLEHLPDGHQCARLHGHNYVAIVEMASDILDDDAFVLDYGKLADFKKYIEDVLDHRHLNDVMGSIIGDPSTYTTAENIAAMLYDWCDERWPNVITAVTVKETDKTRATFRPDTVPSYWAVKQRSETMGTANYSDAMMAGGMRAAP